MAASIRTCFRGFIDYNKSSFIRTEWTIPQDSIALESFSQYRQLKSQDKTGAFDVTFDSLTLRDRSTIWDLFFAFPFDSTIFISERLADELIKSNYTGLSIEQTNRIILGQRIFPVGGEDVGI